MKIFGIIGWPLGYSFSQRYFSEKFVALGIEGEYRYCLFPLESIAGLGTVLNEYRDELAGFNVTIPYKKEVIPWLDAVSEEAQAIGAVNCVKVEGGRLTGYNTDAAGFRAGLEKLLGGEKLPRALVLGTGGASCAVRWVLEKAGIEYRMVSRMGGNGLLSYAELTPEIVASHRLIVNTTPLGMFPNTDSKPDIPYDAVGTGHFLYDLVYNPAVTAFLAEGARRGAATINGDTMLYAQAEENWKIWNNS